MRHLSALSLIALAAGCTTYDPVTPASGPMVVTSPPTAVAAPVPSVPVVVAAPSSAARPGHGRIESITWLGNSAAAGGSQPMRRFHIRMDDGTLQIVDSAAEGFSTGDWVELTREGYIRRS
jgi:hypothetical protein